MDEDLLFLLAPEAVLPQSGCCSDDLNQAQLLGPRVGFALRLFGLGRDADLDQGLAELPIDGSLTGAQRRLANGTQLICDAIVPSFEPSLHWLGVYRSDPDGSGRLSCLDAFALSEAANETCWFYPTHDGAYLSWERELQLSLAPGRLAEQGSGAAPLPYRRQSIAVLWSLLADDRDLTCVGLTYGGQRIDWPLAATDPEPMVTWSRFVVDSKADNSLMVVDRETVRGTPGTRP